MPIRVLPPQVAARIAAGEVVERPASIVKELIENALDAGATHIAVEVAGGGIESIRVVDDGCGIERNELCTAFERHATSKLEDGDDLSRILTLGFRGEALPSIAAAGVIEAVSRPSKSDEAASIRLGPELEPVLESRGAPVGTSFTVRQLFARQPARRKFLRSPSSESGAIAAVVTAYALAYPEIRFSLTVDGRQSLTTTGSGDLRDAAAAVYGAEVAGAMIDVNPLAGPAGVSGLAGPPQVSRAGRGYVTLFVNRRWIQNRRLTYAVEQAYEGLLMTGRRPIAVLNLRVPYEEVDVNVHPTKAEVRFRDESMVFGVLQKTVRQALLASAPAPGLRTAVGAPPLSPAAQSSASLLWQHAVSAEDRRAAAATITAPASSPPMAGALPMLRVIGQFGAVYIIAEGPEGMYLIDQHAAHERVLYEEFLAKRSRQAPDVQGLLEPLVIDLTPRQRAILLAEGNALAGHGFDIEAFGEGGAYLVRALPAALAADPRTGITKFLELMVEEPEIDGRDRVAMSLACHGAVRAGKTLTPEEMRDLVRQLEGTASPSTCPHGRPTMVHMSAELLAREFGRR